MTNEEAIEHLKKNYLMMLNNKAFYKETHIESIGIAINALEKQILKKPIWFEYKYCRFTKCPTCRQPFGFNSRFDYCDNCGQAIDWSEENETIQKI